MSATRLVHMLECAHARTHVCMHARAWKRSGMRARVVGQAGREMKIERRTYYTISRLCKRFCQLYVVAPGAHSRIARALQSASASPWRSSGPPEVAATAARLCVPRCMPFVTIQDADAECRASFATSRRRERILYRGLSAGVERG